MSNAKTSDDATHELVKKAYGEIARKQSSCCGGGGGLGKGDRHPPRREPVPISKSSSCCGDAEPYTVPDHPVPESELGLSCGNPLAFGHINPGDVVLDLGSGAGKDVFLAAQKVGAAGLAIGVDMTPEMLALAGRNAEKFLATTGLANVEFRKGMIEDLPVQDASVDVAISNCVINLSPDKPRVFREVYRVLRPGGRMIVSDIVLNRPMPPELKDDAKLFAACLAGALMREDYLQAVRAAGFPRVEVLSDNAYVRHQAADDPITGGAAEVLAAIAASIIVLAVK